MTDARRSTITTLGVVAAAGVLTVGLAGQAVAAPVAAPATPSARTVLDGKSLGLTGPDDLTALGGDLFVSFQNGVPSTGGAATGPSQSTIVELTPAGVVKHRWQLTGKCDGLTADPAGHRLIATVNEDGNSSLFTIPTDGGPAVHYAYDANPLPHGGGTDSITVYKGGIYLAASAPTAGGPALYRVTLADGVAHLAAAPFFDSSTATVANTGGGAPVNLALTDPDSSTVVPTASPRFAGDYELTAQGDQQMIFASRLGTDRQKLQVLNISQSVDDTAFASSRSGTLYATDSTHDSVVAVTGPLHRGTAYTAATPGNANSAPANPGPNYLASIDLGTGTVSPVTTTGVPLEPKGLIYLPTGSDHTDSGDSGGTGDNGNRDGNDGSGDGVGGGNG
jgi:hypothetical protein